MRTAALVTLASSGCITALTVTSATTTTETATAPGFSLSDQAGKPATLADALARGPVVLVFYRGYW